MDWEEEEEDEVIPSNTAVQTILDRLEFPDKVAIELNIKFNIYSEDLLKYIKSDIDLLAYIATQENVSITVLRVVAV